MKKSILVIGIGRFGMAVIEGLYEQGQDVFAIDQDEEILDKVRDFIVSGAVMDVGSDDEELIHLVGEKNFDEAVVAMGQDFEGALIATSVLKDAGIKVSVKAPNERRGNVLIKMGADRVVYPERDMGYRLATLISTESTIDFLELPQGFLVERMEVGNGFNNRTIEEIDPSNRFGIWMMLLYRNDEAIQPKANTRLIKGDVMVVFGQKAKMRPFEDENFGK